MNLREYWQRRPAGVVVSAIHEPDYRQLPPAQLPAAAADNLRHWYDRNANLPPAFFADFGTVSMAKPWGGAVEVSDDGRPFIHPAADTLDEALAIAPADNPDLDTAVGLYQELRRLTGMEELEFKTPDFQGVLNTAAMVLRQEAFLMATIEEPDKLGEFLDRVCEANIAFMRSAIDRAGRVDGNIWPYVSVPHDVGVCITEDMMPLLSPDQYKQFGLPQLQRISDAFGGVFIHCCGRWGQHAENLAASGVHILGAEFHYPFTTIDQIRPHLPDAVLVPYLADFATDDYESFEAYLARLIEDHGGDGPLWVALSDADGWPVAEAKTLADDAGRSISLVV